MLPINREISQYNHYNGNNIKFIVLHYVGAVSSAKNNADYFAGGDRNASAHYFVDDSSIWQSVEDYNGAWHVGNTRTEVNNRNSIGIEMCCKNDGNLTISAQTEANAVELVKYLMAKYGVPVSNVRTHYEVSGCTKVCPNWSANNWQRWTNFKSKLTNNASTLSTQSTVKKEEKKVKGIVIYSNDIDRRAAEYLADAFHLPTIRADIPFDYTTVEQSGIYAVGGKKGTYTGYLKDENFISGKDRYETAKAVLQRIG